jgi:hypothetical protein
MREGAGTHPAYASMLSGGRRPWKAVNRGGGAQAGCRENGDADNEIGRPSSIPLEGSKREDQRSSWTI